MNSKKITNQNTGISTQKISIITGILFLFAFIVPTMNWTFILSRYNVENNAVLIAKNIMADEILFRTGILIELFMAIAIIVLAWALYIILKQVNRNFALLAFVLKLTEATIAAIIVLVSFIALQIFNGETYLTAITAEQLKYPLVFILRSHTEIFSIPMVFLGLDMMIFCYLFLKSKYIPNMLAGFGVLAFALIFIHALLYILAPQVAETGISQIIFWGPSGIFELIIGIWLLVKGLNIPSQEIKPS